MRCQPHYFERRGEFIKSVAFKPNNGRVLQTAAWLYSFSFLLAFPPSYLHKFCTEMAVFPPKIFMSMCLILLFAIKVQCVISMLLVAPNGIAEIMIVAKRVVSLQIML